MDAFVEQIVKKKKTNLNWALIFGAVVLAMLLIFFAFLFVGRVALLFTVIVMGVGGGAWWVVTEQNREFEYCVTNGDIDIDEIIAQRRRRRIVSVRGSKVEALLPYEKGKTVTQGFQRQVMAAPSLQATGLWYFTYHSKKNGRTIVIFQPRDKVLEALYAGLQRTVQLDTDRALQAQGISMRSRRSAEE